MVNTTSNEVCDVTYHPASGPYTFTVSNTEHHKKAHLLLTDVPISPSCARSFIVKTLVTWKSGADVKVEYGTNGLAGFSDGLVYGEP